MDLVGSRRRRRWYSCGSFGQYVFDVSGPMIVIHSIITAVCAVGFLLV